MSLFDQLDKKELISDSYRFKCQSLLEIIKNYSITN